MPTFSSPWSPTDAFAKLSLTFPILGSEDFYRPSLLPAVESSKTLRSRSRESRAIPIPFEGLLRSGQALSVFNLEPYRFVRHLGGDCVLAVLDKDHQDLVSKGQNMISLGRCDLPLHWICIDANASIFLQSDPADDPQKLSVSMTKAIRVSLDGQLSYMSGSHVSDSPSVYRYPYDEDSDLESDLDEDPPFDIPEMSDIGAREPRPDSLSCPSSPANITDLNTPKNARPCQNSPTWSELEGGVSGGIRMFEYDQAESPVCDVQVDESMGRAEEYQSDKVEPQEKVSASPSHLALINDVAFRTFRAVIVYMYTKEVAFIPLKSSGGRSYNAGDACSPKSTYRLTIKVGCCPCLLSAFGNI
ncbi:hypothetical protein EDD85DRAFT_968732 [Armillaria nabsnona]|nr:hypothetical protein EDD85DRAFT_968732 [Armillaria nabsnona]